MTSYTVDLFDLPEDCVLDCSTPGQSADESVEYWLKNKTVTAILDAIPVDRIRSCLKGYGAWDSEELDDVEQNRARLLWIMCADFREFKTSDGVNGSDLFSVE